MPKSRSITPQIPRYWVTLGKKIIFDYPAKYEGDMRVRHDIYEHVPAISNLLREYVDSPIEGLVEKKFEADIYGITDILKAADRRIGKRQWGKLPQTEVISEILTLRS